MERPLSLFAIEVADPVSIGRRRYSQPRANQEVRRGDLQKFLTSYFNAFPDLHAEIEDIFGEGDKVLSRVICRGTHKGELMGMPPTGKHVAMRVICDDRFTGRKVAESFELPDFLGMMQQLGAVPMPTQARA